MFVGHYGVSFAAGRAGVTLPLWVWFLAVQWLDIVFGVLVLAGVEKVRITEDFTEANDLDLYYMPFTHGLPGALVLSLIGAGIVAAAFPAARSLLALGLVALVSFSHWLLDLVVHTPDLPLYDNTAKVGLGLWDHVAISFPLELAVLGIGVWIYSRSAAPSGLSMRWVWGFAAVLGLFQVYANFAPSPTSSDMFAVSALVLYAVLAAAAAWVERRALADHDR
jgi:hypothetical protein